MNKTKEKKKIGILTFQRTTNYGAQLQSYALQEYLKNYKNLQIQVINYKNKKIEKMEKYPKFSEQHELKQVIKCLLTKSKLKKRWENFEKFRDEYINLTKEYTGQDLENTTNIYDYFLVGSDQVWNMDLTGNDFNYMLDFLKNDKKKYAYAASIGNDTISEKKLNEIIQKLENFQLINVREETAKELLEKCGIKNVNVVMDPVFLMSKNEWISKLNLTPKKGNYIFVYMINKHNENIKKIKKYAKKKHLKIVYINNNVFNTSGVRNLKSASPKEFLEYLYGAKYIVTGSFHAVSLSLIFNKNFCYILNNEKKRNSRITDMIKRLEIGDRGISDEDEIKIPNINYTKINKLINKEITKSKKILEKMIQEWCRE